MCDSEEHEAGSNGFWSELLQGGFELSWARDTWDWLACGRRRKKADLDVTGMSLRWAVTAVWWRAVLIVLYRFVQLRKCLVMDLHTDAFTEQTHS